MTTAQATSAACAVLITVAAGFFVGHYVGAIPEMAGLHGPVAELVALPFVLVALIGAAILSVVVRRRRERMTRTSRIIAGVPIWLVAGIMALWVVANLLPHGGG
jgi:hypothetical protein